MSTPTEEIEVDLGAADPKAVPKSKTDEVDVEIVAEPAKNGKKPDISPEEGVDKLKKDLAAEKLAREEADRRRISAETRANEAAHGEAAAKTEVQSTQLDLVKGAIERVKTENAGLKSKLSAAFAAQDFDTAADIQLQMSENGGRLAQLEAGKTALEKAPKIAPRAPDDPVEKLCANLSPQSATWVRAHPNFATGPAYADMIEAHNHAIRRGLKHDTPEYFAHIEKRLDITPAVARTAETSQESDPMTDAATPAAPKTPAAAPVSRSNGHANRIRLTAAEQEAARISFPDSKDPDREYALSKMALQREGKLQ